MTLIDHVYKESAVERAPSPLGSNMQRVLKGYSFNVPIILSETIPTFHCDA